MNATSHQASEMSHVYQEQGSHLVGDLAHAGKVDDPGVGAPSPDDELGLFALSSGFETVVVDPF